ncbi:protein-glutamine gamma-glutamyltransferase E-like [Rhinatrema bivittatum]|uniref:protein-glutamine gamma-glutamyltransferase E-like n=1 Tax=Rhinatrema bivittatum TaxID=194408 RepID=UPI00112C7F0A|nr:protein-glutamine gamma-glutamyltransferase E-like [Rhinatrema bivittatum]XP_029466690.1 protein-glutamine gamma-glutamyltransferase E-like [Rhinatrema bivittatum]XP_029466691.1 protein-glutamine gamma-glutamyltransferase E-like [Rhinatrema bivittatum]XP_029466692.1 protein-glutamine gamma-glutamyltransferase E-like [Rhinatrema bivittatum]XP_029466693.1 protein-glutamine gamma-glutamyltransferase E-like [Rhinatrema bivittatum]
MYKKGENLAVLKFNLHLASNKTEHRTDYYRSSELIVRRGQNFKIALTLNRAVQPKESITFTAETGPSPSESDNTKAVFPLSNSGNKDGAWCATYESSDSSDLDITIFSPSTSVIGCYKLSAQISSKSKTSSKNLKQFMLLFNPWAADDAVYMPNEDERQEYVLTDNGVIYVGHEKYIEERGWNYGQFEEDILDISLALLDQNLNQFQDPALDCSQRCDPVYVSRVVSAMINSKDDKGVLVGNWSGKYSGGISPLRWYGSTDILQKWYQRQFKSVEYGQCWVFAGVMCTVLRCLGIPARVITNFSSAHDTNANLTIDEYYDYSGQPTELSNDSIWNFHVWNEAWFARKDLGSSFDGWQVLDATPQEISKGIYCCGPTSVSAIKEGHVDLDYDTPFVYSEVNADRAIWICYSNKKPERVHSDTRTVGQCISTKAVGSFDRVDVTNNYKYAEGSDKERKVHEKAYAKLLEVKTKQDKQKRKKQRHMGGGSSNEPASPGVSGKFKLMKAPVFGQEINLMLVLTNLTSASKAVKVNMDAHSILYTGKPLREILKESKSATVGPKGEERIPFDIPYPKYKTYLNNGEMMEVTAVCETEDGVKALVRKDISLESPPINIMFRGKAIMNQPVDVEVTLANPLSVTVKGCFLILEGSGLIEGQLKKKVPLLNPNEIFRIQVEVTPSKSGTKQLLAGLTSEKFADVKGFQVVEVAEA